MLLASIVNSVVSSRQVSALRFDFENATVKLDHQYGYTDRDFTSLPQRASGTRSPPPGVRAQPAIQAATPPN